MTGPLTSQVHARWPQRSSLGGGTPAQQRKLGAQGRERVRRLLEAGLTEFRDRGFRAARVDDIVRRAQSSHGTFYLYFSSKEDLFRALLRDALHDMRAIAGEFPVVTHNRAGKGALRAWVQRYCDTYATYAQVLGPLSQAELVGKEVWGDGLQTLFGLAGAITAGMTAASQRRIGERSELTALACVMMLERVNYLLSAGVRLPGDEVADRLSAIIDAAFGLTLAPSADVEPGDTSKQHPYGGPPVQVVPSLDRAGRVVSCPR